MSLGTKSLQHMQDLIEHAGQAPTQENPLTVALGGEAGGVEVEVCAYGDLGVALNSLTVWGNVGDAPLETLAQEISRRVIYLLEPLALIERDLDQEHVQMRSAPPLEEDQAIEYYEGQLTRSNGSPRVHLVRYRQSNAQRRRTQVSITLTRDVFRRLVDDLADILTNILLAPEAE